MGTVIGSTHASVAGICRVKTVSHLARGQILRSKRRKGVFGKSARRKTIFKYRSLPALCSRNIILLIIINIIVFFRATLSTLIFLCR